MGNIMKSLSEYNLSTIYPNFTVILPGPCQSRCAFCTEPEGPAPASSEDYQRKAKEVISTLPNIFRTLSISGGEPTLSNEFRFLMDTVREKQRSAPLPQIKQFYRVVLTTNGINLHNQLDVITGVVTNVNFSRHAANEYDNQLVFTKNGQNKGKVVTKEKLKELIKELNQRGIEANLNCVYSDNHFMGRTFAKLDDATVKQKTFEYIEMAKNIGATSIVFRRDHHSEGEFQPTRLESLFDEYQTVKSDACESCYVVSKYINGMAVNFKQSRYEPIKYIRKDTLYELVLHSTGNLYADWGRNHPIALPFPRKSAFHISDYGTMILKPEPVESECNVDMGVCTIIRLQFPLNADCK